jgi:uncharacterized protein
VKQYRLPECIPANTLPQRYGSGYKKMTGMGFIRAQKEGVLLSIKLQPRASGNEIGTALGDELKVKVTAPPVDAAANEALVRLLAERLGCPRNRVELVRGHTSRHKSVMVYGFSVEEVVGRLHPG